MIACKTCVWWVPVVPDSDQGTCRFNPPGDKGFPYVTEKGFCAKHTRKMGAADVIEQEMNSERTSL